MDDQAPHNVPTSGRRDLASPLLFVAVAAGAFGSAATLLLIALSHTTVQYPSWLAWVTGMGSGLSEDDISVSAGGVVLAICFVGLTLGITGWVIARRRGASLSTAKLAVLISLVGPLAVVVAWSLGIAEFVITGVPT